MKKHLSTIVVVVIFVCGLSLFLYPTISNLYNENLNHQLIGDYQDACEEVAPEQFVKAKADAKAYNQYLNDTQKREELGLTYESMLNVTGSGVMGYIDIPKISVSLVIQHSLDEDVLQNSIGHSEDSALPIGGKSTHCVLAGHTGLPSAKLLTNIDQLKIGDEFYIHVLDEVLEYRIDNIVVVEPHETSRLNVVSGKDYVTLVTCTPYGVNSHRLLVRGERVGNADSSADNALHVKNDLLNIEMEYLLTFSLIGLAAMTFAVYKIVKMIKKKNAMEKEGEEDATKTEKLPQNE